MTTDQVWIAIAILAIVAGLTFVGYGVWLSVQP